MCRVGILRRAATSALGAGYEHPTDHSVSVLIRRGRVGGGAGTNHGDVHFGSEFDAFDLVTEDGPLHGEPFQRLVSVAELRGLFDRPLTCGLRAAGRFPDVRTCVIALPQFLTPTAPDLPAGGASRCRTA